MATLINEEDIKVHIERLATEIYQTNSGQLVFLGLGDNGKILAKRIAKCILTKFGDNVLVGQLDVTLYKRHDQKDHFVTLGKSEISFTLQNKTVILITDQVNTGRTMIAGLNALSDYSEPNVVKCCCLVFRDCIRRPIHFDYIGEAVSTVKSVSLTCCFYEKDGEDVVKDLVNEHV